MFDILPNELVEKIIFYSHPTLSKNIQNDIKNFIFNRKMIRYKSILCEKCYKYHRIPRHFRCF